METAFLFYQYVTNLGISSGLKKVLLTNSENWKRGYNSMSLTVYVDNRKRVPRQQAQRHMWVINRNKFDNRIPVLNQNSL